MGHMSPGDRPGRRGRRHLAAAASTRASPPAARSARRAWFETLSKDYDKAVPFYRDVFGWDLHTMSDTPEFRYTTHGLNEDAKAGIMDGSGFLGEQPSRWQFYVEVADTDATVAQAEAKGATVVQPAEDTPYGRLALLNDPEGVQFAVMSNPAS